MSVPAATAEKVVDGASYSVVHRDADRGIAIVEDARGHSELWERVDGYRGEIMVIDGEEYRFLRTWKGSRGRN